MGKPFDMEVTPGLDIRHRPLIVLSGDIDDFRNHLHGLQEAK